MDVGRCINADICISIMMHKRDFCDDDDDDVNDDVIML